MTNTLILSGCATLLAAWTIAIYWGYEPAIISRLFKFYANFKQPQWPSQQILGNVPDAKTPVDQEIPRIDE